MKRICCFVLIFVMIFTLSVSASAAELTDEQKANLYELGIMTGDESGDLRPESSITRAEAVKMLCTAGGLKAQNGESVVFPDVPDYHWASAYINTANNRGLISGDEYGCFNPESLVTNEELVKMIVCLLGYGPMAENNGGFPAGYTAVASAQGITKDLGLQSGVPATRNDAGIMICRALDVPLMLQKPSEDGTITEYYIANGEYGLPHITLRGGVLSGWDTSLGNIDKIAQRFASQYKYHEGDETKSFSLYPDVPYTSGIEPAGDGTEYECPAVYDDNMAQELLNEMKKGTAKLVIDGQETEEAIPYAVYDSGLLVHVSVFRLTGCTMRRYENGYVVSLSKDGVTLEIIPNLIGMRKNEADGYWVPLAPCARIIDDVFYVPLKAVAKEFDIDAVWDAEAETVELRLTE